MKKFFVLSLLILLFTSSCHKMNVKEELRIDLGTQFQSDDVAIKLDGKTIYSKTITTISILGISEIITLQHPVGRCKLSVNVNGKIVKDQFIHQKDRFIYISYQKPTETISITYPAEKYIYD